MSNLPPGVSENDIPGNRPEDLLAEDMGEHGAEYYFHAILLLGKNHAAAKALRKAMDAVEKGIGGDSDYLNDVETDYEVNNIQENLHSLEMDRWAFEEHGPSSGVNLEDVKREEEELLAKWRELEPHNPRWSK